MEKKNLEEKDMEMTSLNDQNLGEYSIEELEERLETDPLFMGNLFGGNPDNGDTETYGCCFLGKNCNEDN